ACRCGHLAAAQPCDPAARPVARRAESRDPTGRGCSRSPRTGSRPPGGRTTRPHRTAGGRLLSVAGVPIEGAVRELLESDAVAQIVTLNDDGSPQVTAAWVGVEGDEIVLATLPDQRKLRNL